MKLVHPHNITIVKQCRPLFGLVKHHVCTRFQNCDDSNDGFDSPDLDGNNTDPFTSLPPNLMNSVNDYEFKQPASMPSSPFLSQRY